MGLWSLNLLYGNIWFSFFFEIDPYGYLFAGPPNSRRNWCSGHTVFNVRRLWSWGERKVIGAVCLQEYFLKGFVCMPYSWQSSCAQLSREWWFLFAAAFKVFNCVFFIWKQKKILLDSFHQNWNVWFGCKNSGCVLKAVHILLLLALVCKGIRCHYGRFRSPLSLWHRPAKPLVCVCACPHPSSLPACFPRQL